MSDESLHEARLFADYTLTSVRAFLATLPVLEAKYEFHVGQLVWPRIVPGGLEEYCSHLSFCVLAAYRMAKEEPIDPQLLRELAPVSDVTFRIDREDLPDHLHSDIFDDLEISDGPSEWPGFVADTEGYLQLIDRNSTILVAAGAEMLRASCEYLRYHGEIDWLCRAGGDLKAVLDELSVACAETLPLLRNDVELEVGASDAPIANLRDVVLEVKQRLPQLLFYIPQASGEPGPNQLVCDLLRDAEAWISAVFAVHMNVSHFIQKMRENDSWNAGESW